MESRERFLNRVRDLTHPEYCQRKDQLPLIIEAYLQHMIGVSEPAHYELDNEEHIAVSEIVTSRERLHE